MGDDVYREAEEYLAGVTLPELMESRQSVMEFTSTRLGAISMAVIVTRTWDKAFRRGLLWGTGGMGLVAILLRVLL